MRVQGSEMCKPCGRLSLVAETPAEEQLLGELQSLLEAPRDNAQLRITNGRRTIDWLLNPPGDPHRKAASP